MVYFWSSRERYLIVNIVDDVKRFPGGNDETILKKANTWFLCKWSKFACTFSKNIELSEMVFKILQIWLLDSYSILTVGVLKSDRENGEEINDGFPSFPVLKVLYKVFFSFR